MKTFGLVLSVVALFVAYAPHAFAAPLVKFDDKDNLPGGLCPYKCQSAFTAIGDRDSIITVCIPDTESLDAARNAHPPSSNFRPLSKIEQAHLSCEISGCGELTYQTVAGESATVSRCSDAGTLICEEGDFIPDKKLLNDIITLYEGDNFAAKGGEINPDKMQRGTLGRVFDELKGFIPLEGGDMGEIDPKGLYPEQEYNEYFFGELQKELDNPGYKIGSDSLPPEYIPEIPYVPSDGKRVAIELGGDLYSVPRDAFDQYLLSQRAGTAGTDALSHSADAFHLFSQERADGTFQFPPPSFRSAPILDPFKTESLYGSGGPPDIERSDNVFKRVWNRLYDRFMAFLGK